MNAAAPQRRRPGSQSPILLTPKVEAVSTPATPVTPAAAPTSEPAAEPAAAPVRAVATPATPVKKPRATATRSKPAPPVAPEVPVDDAKIARTFLMPRMLVKTAETAVLRTGGLPGGYKSMAALMNGALARELERLAGEFNDGEPYPPNGAEFRVGRPLG
jgi:hypothetical protein